MFRYSTKLILIIAFLITASVVKGVYVLNEISSLKNDANIINHAGVIRGSIQRISKLESNKIPADPLIREIDAHLEYFISMKENYRMKGDERRFADYFNKLNSQWILLKQAVIAYRNHSNEESRKSLIQISEQCWNISNSIVFSAQAVSETKVHEFKIGLVLSLTDIVLLIFVLYLLKIYVRDKLEDMANYDTLTKAFNRSIFADALEKEIIRAERYQRPLSLIFIDIDFFKRINDTYGHNVGDKVLYSLSDIIRSSIRQNDIFCRIGGEEFAIIAPETDLKAAFTLAEKTRLLIEKSEFSKVGGITVSMGVTAFLRKDNRETFTIRADNNLYKAKEKGRNRTEAS